MLLSSAFASRCRCSSFSACIGHGHLFKCLPEPPLTTTETPASVHIACLVNVSCSSSTLARRSRCSSFSVCYINDTSQSTCQGQNIHHTTASMLSVAKLPVVQVLLLLCLHAIARGSPQKYSQWSTCKLPYRLPAC